MTNISGSQFNGCPMTYALYSTQKCFGCVKSLIFLHKRMIEIYILATQFIFYFVNLSLFTKVQNDNFYGITAETRSQEATTLKHTKLMRGKYFKPKSIKIRIYVLSKFVINTEFGTILSQDSIYFIQIYTLYTA